MMHHLNVQSSTSNISAPTRFFFSTVKCFITRLCSIGVSTPRCGRGNPGSIPGEVSPFAQSPHSGGGHYYCTSYVVVVTYFTSYSVIALTVLGLKRSPTKSHQCASQPFSLKLFADCVKVPKFSLPISSRNLETVYFQHVTCRRAPSYPGQRSTI